jgi:hypothetical protein
MSVIFAHLLLISLAGALANDASAPSNQNTAATAQDTTPDPGDGVLVLFSTDEDHFNEDTPFPVRDAAGKKRGALLFRRAPEQPSFLMPMGLQLTNGEQLTGTGSAPFESEVSALKYYERKDEALRVLQPAHSRYPGGLWVHLKEVKRKTEVYSWVELIVKQQGTGWTGFDAYRLRAKPSLEGEVLVQLREQTLWPNKSHGLTPTGKTQGSWVEVTAQTYAGPHSYRATILDVEPGEAVGEPVTGWIKIADDEGLVKDIKPGGH